VPDNFVDFRIVKQRVPIQSVLAHYNIRLRQVNRNSLRGTCPLPTHSSKESKESFCVNIDKNIWSCMSESCSSARQGKRGGNVIDLVALIERSSIRDAALKLNDWFISSTPHAHAVVGKGSDPAGQTGELVSEKKEILPTAPEVVNKPLSFTLKDVDCTHPYVQSRGLSEDTAKEYGVGYFSGKGLMSGRCVIKIHNDRGELIAYAGRSIDAIEPKYKLPAGFKKSDVLFNLHRTRSASSPSDPMIIVEGFFDCMKVQQAGFPHVVALMGSSMSDVQQKLLSECSHVIVFLDGDAAGREGAITIAQKLMHTSFVKVMDLPDGMQPDQLSSDELRRILGSF
jgi:DNA primase